MVIQTKDVNKLNQINFLIYMYLPIKIFGLAYKLIIQK